MGYRFSRDRARCEVGTVGNRSKSEPNLHDPRPAHDSFLEDGGQMLMMQRDKPCGFGLFPETNLDSVNESQAVYHKWNPWIRPMSIFCKHRGARLNPSGLSK
eukprot:s287_g11.t1